MGTRPGCGSRKSQNLYYGRVLSRERWTNSMLVCYIACKTEKALVFIFSIIENKGEKIADLRRHKKLQFRSIMVKR